MERYTLTWSGSDPIHEDCLTGISLEDGVMVLERDHGATDERITRIPILDILKVRVHTGKASGRGAVRILAITYMDGKQKDILCHIPSKKDPGLNAFLRSITKASLFEIEDGEIELYRYILMIIAGMIILAGMLVVVKFSGM